MTDESTATAPITTNTGQSAPPAQFIFFDSAICFGLFNGVAQLTLAASTLTPGPDGKVAIERVIVGHLRCSGPALQSLRDAADRILLMASPPEGQAN